jgi:Spy/CpxP family protein refolding chaperone
MKRIITATLWLLVAIATPVFAAGSVADGQDMQALREAAKADKRGLVTATLNLTPAEAKKFWPVYDTFQRNMDVVNRQRNVALEELLGVDKPMSNLAARNLAREFMAAEQAEIRARQKMFNAVMRALPSLKAARYFQLEQKIATIQAYDIAAAFPLVK